MKITDIRFTQVEGVLAHDGELWESRAAAPIEIYPEFRVEGGGYTPRTPEGDYRIEAGIMYFTTQG